MKRFQGTAFARLDLHGEHEKALRDDEVDFGVRVFAFVEPVKQLGRGCEGGIEIEVLGDELLCERSFIHQGALLEALDIKPVLAAQPTQEADIEKKKFEGADGRGQELILDILVFQSVKQV